MLSDRERRRAFNIIITTQCLGMLTTFLFHNGFYLNYFTKLGYSSSTFALLAATPLLVGGVLLLPFAFWSDRFGKKRLALFGQVLIVASVVLMLAAGWFSSVASLTVVALSLVLYSLGGGVQGSSWFALLGPIIPPEIRGRFFGRLRVSFMTVNMGFTMLVAWVLGRTGSVGAFQVLLLLILVAHVARYFTYARIPELESEEGAEHARQSFWEACASTRAIKGFFEFNGYVFLITLFTAGVPIVFGLMQKDVFGFSPARIMMIGNFYLAGALVGCGVGGPLVDRLGTKIVLRLTHAAYACVVFGMLARHWTPWSVETHVTLCSFLFSMSGGVAGIAISSEALALIPATNKSLSTAVHMTLINLGMALSAVFVSRAIGWGMLADTWTALNQTFSAYDALLAGFGVMIVLMFVAIGLVPKVVKTANLMPGSGLPRG